MDSRDTRRAAEKAARALLHARAAVVGDLAVAATGRDTALERVQAAEAEGQALLDAARAQAAQLLTDAHTAVHDAQVKYAAAHAAAVHAGWQPADLHRLGYPPPSGRRRRPRAAPATASATTSAEHATTGSSREEHPQHPAA